MSDHRQELERKLAEGPFAAEYLVLPKDAVCDNPAEWQHREWCARVMALSALAVTERTLAGFPVLVGPYDYGLEGIPIESAEPKPPSRWTRLVRPRERA